MISTHVDKKEFVSIADSIREEGFSAATENIARNLLLKGLDLELVSESTGLDLKIVKKIQKSIH